MKEILDSDKYIPQEILNLSDFSGGQRKEDAL